MHPVVEGSAHSPAMASKAPATAGVSIGRLPKKDVSLSSATRSTKTPPTSRPSTGNRACPPSAGCRLLVLVMDTFLSGQTASSRHDGLRSKFRGRSSRDRLPVRSWPSPSVTPRLGWISYGRDGQRSGRLRGMAGTTPASAASTRQLAVIVDRDGTLASCFRRPTNASSEEWREVNAALPFDASCRRSPL